MRIVGGSFKSRQFSPGKNFKARPTTDFAKENLFNILNNRLDFGELTVLDLFSGTGSISFEFVSRGCNNITSVELDAVHYSFICSVVEKLGVKQHIKPVRADVFRYLAKCGEKFDLIFADPPYQLTKLKSIPDLIFSLPVLKEDGLLILEHGQNDSFSEHPHFFEMRTYGSVHFSFFR